jgi:predicted DNA-binding transcriptional regulator AlpA
MLINERALSLRTGISVRTYQKWRMTGGGPPFVKVSSRCIRYRLSDVSSWIDQNSSTSISQSEIEPTELPLPDRVRASKSAPDALEMLVVLMSTSTYLRKRYENGDTNCRELLDRIEILIARATGGGM